MLPGDLVRRRGPQSQDTKGDSTQADHVRPQHREEETPWIQLSMPMRHKAILDAVTMSMSKTACRFCRQLWGRRDVLRFHDSKMIEFRRREPFKDQETDCNKKPERYRLLCLPVQGQSSRICHAAAKTKGTSEPGHDIHAK